MDDVDEVEPIIDVRQEPAPPSTAPLAGKEVIQVDDEAGPSQGESPKKKRKTVAPPTATAAAASSVGHVGVIPNAPLGEEEVNHVDHSTSRRLVKIVETIKREYIFE